jgi:phosphoribosylanthranilate isomerase
MILKICGITNQEDATAAVEAGATALGFNFYPRSPRYIAPENAAAIFTPAGVCRVRLDLSPRGPHHVEPEKAAGVRRVGVFVNEKPERVAEIARAARLDVAQLHGDETPADYPISPASAPGVQPSAGASDAPVPLPAQCEPAAGGGICATLSVWKALRVTGAFDIALHENDPAEALLLDGPAADLYGGSGRIFDWSLIRQTTRRIVLAGGLDASNVALAIARVRPWGVDACSRIESAPGKKDHKKMKEFLHAAMLAAQS